MSMISDIQSVQTRPFGWSSSFVHLLRRLLHAYRQRKALRRLFEAEDHVLTDLGISRDDLRYAQTHIPARDIGNYLTKVAREGSRTRSTPRRRLSHSAAVGMERLSRE